jgi:hypothetical protein
LAGLPESLTVRSKYINFNGDYKMKIMQIADCTLVAAGVWEGENGEGCIPSPIKIVVKVVL